MADRTLDFSLDLRSVLGPLRRGSGDPCWQEADGRLWLASGTPDGPVALALSLSAGQAHASAYGPGADWQLEQLPGLLGLTDDLSGFVACHPLVERMQRRLPGLRLSATGRVWEVLLAAVLEQLVTGREAWRSWRELALRFGSPAPAGPPGLRVPVSPRRVLELADWEWHKAGVDGARRRTIIRAASVEPRLQEAVALGGAEGRARLRLVPGIGEWTAAEVAQRAWADADAVSVGDYHLAKNVGWALTGAAVDDAGMLELLAPYAPQRHRAVRYIEASGLRRPRMAPRFSPRDYRAV
ncbi:DNA-3-methyladenine glycosylase 2 family protein [Pseudonocardiaceae bacterium YIM PH 21723]|nr:DNA-3-methyladenine glycosylase 2 family protein [Pseudonocardiaceae bacterium YIM PH 21723]